MQHQDNIIAMMVGRWNHAFLLTNFGDKFGVEQFGMTGWLTQARLRAHACRYMYMQRFGV